MKFALLEPGMAQEQSSPADTGQAVASVLWLLWMAPMWYIWDFCPSCKASLFCLLQV